MNKIVVGAMCACLLAGCAMPDQAPHHKLTAAEKACRDAPPPTGSHISSADCDRTTSLSTNSNALSGSLRRTYGGSNGGGK